MGQPQPPPPKTPRARPTKASRPGMVGDVLTLPSQWLAMYEDFIAKNAGQVSQIESALRSLTYIIPGKRKPRLRARESPCLG